MANIAQDLRCAVGTPWRNPGFAPVAILGRRHGHLQERQCSSAASIAISATDRLGKH